MLRFGVSRTVMEQFTNDEEWVEAMVDEPIRRLKQSIVFPKKRPCREAALHYEGRRILLRITRLADGRTRVGFDLRTPSAQTPYVIRRSW